LAPAEIGPGPNCVGRRVQTSCAFPSRSSSWPKERIRCGAQCFARNKTERGCGQWIRLQCEIVRRDVDLRPLRARRQCQDGSWFAPPAELRNFGAPVARSRDAAHTVDRPEGAQRQEVSPTANELRDSRSVRACGQQLGQSSVPPLVEKRPVRKARSTAPGRPKQPWR
jgi:hypothetical protein